MNYSKYPVETVEINKIKRSPANSNGFKVRQLYESVTDQPTEEKEKELSNEEAIWQLCLKVTKIGKK